jgi:hypothetical protein
MVIEIGELDNASQSTAMARGVGDALDVGAVVVVFCACEERERAELNRADPAGAQFDDGQVRAFQGVVQPSGDARVFGNSCCNAPQMVDYRAPA